MNLRCIYCQTPFTLSRMEKLTAIQKLLAENLHHYDAFCPRCRRSNPVSIQRLQIFTPGWQEGLRTLEAEAAVREKEMVSSQAAIPAAQTKAASPAPSASAKKRHASKSAKADTASAKPAKKTSAKAKPSAAKKTSSKPASAKKSTVKKPAKPAAKAKKK